MALKDRLIAGAGRRGFVLEHLREGNLRDLYYRNVFRRRILSSQPLPCSADGPVEVHVLTCQRDYIDTLWSLKTFLFYSGLRLPVVIHDDGTLGRRAVEAIAHHLPGVTFVTRAEADAVAADRLRPFPALLRYRMQPWKAPTAGDRSRRSPLALKLFDAAFFSRSGRFVIIDSDVLFFRAPAELMACVADGRCCFMSDYQNAYAFPVEQLEAWLGPAVLPRLNTGVLHADRTLHDLDRLEPFMRKVFEQPLTWLQHNLLEQTSWAVLFSRSSRPVVRLGPAYQISAQPLGDETVSHHYVNDGLRPRFWDQGLRRLDQQGLLAALAAPPRP